MAYEYIENFKRLGFGMFIHFGLYSVIGKGEWYYWQYKPDQKEYEKNIEKFRVTKNWDKNLVKTAKRAGCKYITLTTRHHDGFSLYDTCGLNDFDAPHSATGRDLVREFVDECNAEGIVPFFYHTLLDWHNTDYITNFKERFGRNDFDSMVSEFMLDGAVTYILKYIEKSGEKMIYSRGLPQFFISDIMEDDVICPIGEEDRKLLLFDNFSCWDEGCYMGKVSKEVIAQMPKCN